MYTPKKQKIVRYILLDKESDIMYPDSFESVKEAFEVRKDNPEYPRLFAKTTTVEYEQLGDKEIAEIVLQEMGLNK